MMNIDRATYKKPLTRAERRELHLLLKDNPTENERQQLLRWLEPNRIRYGSGTR